MMYLIVDVRSREEYYKNHIKGSLNIPVFDLKYYVDFLRGQDVHLSCDTGTRAKIAGEFLIKRGIKAAIVSQEKRDELKSEGSPIVCAINYLSVKPGLEKAFEDETRELCRATYAKTGFLGSKILRVSNISYGGTGLQGPYENIDIKPTKYVMLTFWTNKTAHEEFHKERDILEGFTGLMKYLAVMPFEEYGEILR